MPNHDTGFFPYSGNPYRIAAQALSYGVTMSSSLTNIATSVQVIGVGLNGLKMEPMTAEVYSDTPWRYEALTFGGRLVSDSANFPSEITTPGLDCNFAHVQPDVEYHYRGVPTALMPDSTARNLVGWAADGYPVFGRFGHETPETQALPSTNSGGATNSKAGADNRGVRVSTTRRE